MPKNSNTCSLHNSSTSSSSAARKKNTRSEKLEREEFGDPSSLESFRGPWARYVKKPKIEKNIKNSLEQLKQIKIVNKHCLELGKEMCRVNIRNPVKFYQSNTLIEPISILPTKSDQVFHLHKESTTKLRFLNCHNLLCSSGVDGKLYVLDYKQKKEVLKTFLGHSKAISGFHISDDDKWLSTISYDKFFKFWNFETGKCLKAIPLEGYPLCIAGHSSLIAIGCSDGLIAIIDCMLKRVIKEIDTKNMLAHNETKKTNNLYACFAIYDIAMVGEEKLAFTTYGGTYVLYNLNSNSIMHERMGCYTGLFVLANLYAKQMMSIEVWSDKLEKVVSLKHDTNTVGISAHGDILYYCHKGKCYFHNLDNEHTSELHIGIEDIVSVDWSKVDTCSIAFGTEKGDTIFWST